MVHMQMQGDLCGEAQRHNNGAENNVEPVQGYNKIFACSTDNKRPPESESIIVQSKHYVQDCT